MALRHTKNMKDSNQRLKFNLKSEGSTFIQEQTIKHKVKQYFLHTSQIWRDTDFSEVGWRVCITVESTGYLGLCLSGV